MGRYSVAICLRDYQVVSFKRKEEILMSGSLSPFFELEPHPEKGSAPRPGVPKNRTTIKLPTGRALLKSKQYLCIMAWAFWVDDPIRRDDLPGQLGAEQLQQILDNLKARGETEKAAELEEILKEMERPPQEAAVPIEGDATELTEQELRDFKPSIDLAELRRLAEEQ